MPAGNGIALIVSIASEEDEMSDSYPYRDKRELTEGVNPYQPDRSESRSARSRYSILVVDDMEHNVLMFTRVLDKLGYRHGHAINGLQAVKAVTEGIYDLILMDCQMPVMDGIDATRAIRGLADPLCHIPIIAITANAALDNITRCFDAGMNDFVAKPPDFDRIDGLILKWIGMGEEGC